MQCEEMTSFPIRDISIIAEKESWRKEIHRPIYHIHKWWAQRLGSVFRAIILHLLSNGEGDISDFYATHSHNNKVIFDPFMGSGTTLGEALKLGANVVGCDINPVSSFLVEQALSNVSLQDMDSAYRLIESRVAEKISKYYVTKSKDTGDSLRVLYYFWVKEVLTPDNETIPLFKKYVFSQNAYPSKKPRAQILCPNCWDVYEDAYNSTNSHCPHCGFKFNPQDGPVKGSRVRSSTGQLYKIKDLLPRDGSLLHEKMYALLAIKSSGEKVYQSIQDCDLALYKEASEAVPKFLPTYEVKPGYNTNQAIGYNYTRWSDFFNSRQKLALSILLEAIRDLSDIRIRNQFLCLFSSVLEFNNTFCSYKGEGTGAIRPIFSHHILKPERTPVENSVWGGPGTSGTFTSLYKSRLLKAKQYLNTPVEVSSDVNSHKVLSSFPIHPYICHTWNDFHNYSLGSKALILNGDSAKIAIPNASVDFVVTDPPYFDFINYSELSDFFYAWLSPIFKGVDPIFEIDTSRRPCEVQHSDPDIFSKSLGDVFRQCNRVLKSSGKLAFSFHHSKLAAWQAVLNAISSSGLFVCDVFPVHAELMASTPKSAASSPISIDAIIVCQKQHAEYALNDAVRDAIYFVKQLSEAKSSLSEADLFVIAASLAVRVKSNDITTDISLNCIANNILNELSILHIKVSSNVSYLL